MYQKVKNYFGKLKGNSAVCIAAHPFWAVPYMFYTYYISLYLLEKGITDAQLGTLMVAGTVSATVFSFLSAPVVDRLGRRNATLIFDLLSSAIPPLIYFLAKDFFLALIAMVLFNANRLMSVAYYLVMIFLLISFAVMTAMILIRHHLLKETKVGEKVRQEARAEKISAGALLKGLWKPYRDALVFLKDNRVARAFTLANVFFCVYMNLGTNYSLYFVPYFADRMGMDTMQSSVLGSVYYGGMLAAMIFINPRFGRKNLVKGILFSGAVTTLGFVLMVGVPAGVYWLAIAATLVLAVGYGALKSSMEGALAVYSESEYRSGIYSAANLLSSGLGVVVTAVCSVLYGRWAGWLYVLCGIMVLAALGAIVSVAGKVKE